MQTLITLKTFEPEQNYRPLQEWELRVLSAAISQDQVHSSALRSQIADAKARTVDENGGFDIRVASGQPARESAGTLVAHAKPISDDLSDVTFLVTINSLGILSSLDIILNIFDESSSELIVVDVAELAFEISGPPVFIQPRLCPISFENFTSEMFYRGPHDWEQRLLFDAMKVPFPGRDAAVTQLLDNYRAPIFSHAPVYVVRTIDSRGSFEISVSKGEIGRFTSLTPVVGLYSGSERAVKYQVKASIQTLPIGIISSVVIEVQSELSRVPPINVQKMKFSEPTIDGVA